MSDQHDRPIAVRFEFVDADPQRPDPAEVNRVSYEAADALRSQGYRVTPAYTGTRSGGAFDMVLQGAQVIYDNREALLAALRDIAALLGALSQLKKKKPEQPAAPAPIVIVLQQPPLSVSIDPARHPAPTDQQLLEALLAVEPELLARITPATQVTARVPVPRRPPAF